MSTRRLAVVSAGLSTPSSTRLLADRLTESVTAALAARGVQATVDLVELRQHARDLADNLVTGFPGRALRESVDAVGGADGLIAVTPVFSASYSGLFKTFFDVLDAEALAGQPVLLAATAGTARHSLVLDHALRPLLTYLRAVPMPTGVFAAPEDWADTGGPSGALSDRIGRAAQELAEAVAVRPPRRQPDRFADVVPFEQLLTGS
jgi:FMN reductase